MTEEAQTTTTTTTESQQDRDAYRFGGVRYKFQGTDTSGPDWMVYEIPGLSKYPKSDDS